MNMVSMMSAVGYDFVLHLILIATLQFAQVSLLDADSLVYLTSQVTRKSYGVNVSGAWQSL